MLNNQELIKRVRGYFDLNIYETKVWLALLSRGVCSAGEISELSGVPRSRTYDVLESLEKRGFVVQKIGKPVKYLAVNPEIVIEKLKNNTLKDAENRVNLLNKLKESQEYEELKMLHKTGIEPIKTHELSAAIKGRSNLYLQMRSLIENAEKSVYLSTSAYELLSKERMFKDLFSKLNRRKIDVRVMIPDSLDEVKKIAKRFKVPVRMGPIHARFVIVDNKEFMFTMKPTNVHEDFDHGIWINSQFFTSSLSYLFRMAWDSAEEAK